ncbi:MAG TPA: right-handed parallel beta-helix repeat-containing protein [Verrucomicrobiae bacterium]|nr:right-handed parallel beta-helix repeat-containing protein [Verrucomicrobiae bacterium]
MHLGLKIRLFWLILFVALLANASIAVAVDLWVAADGSDANTGTFARPFLSLDAALKKAENIRKRSSSKPIHIILRGGEYFLNRPLQIRAILSGKPSHPTVITSAKNEHPVLSGGIVIRDWRRAGSVPNLPHDTSGKIWAAKIPIVEGQPLKFRALWVNGRKGTLAREPNTGNMLRLIAWDKTNQTATIPASAISGVPTIGGLEMVVDQVWEIAVLRFKSARINGTNALVTFCQPESKIEFQHPWPPVTVSSNYAAPFFLANAIQFLNSPGEWFEDLSAGQIYYWPRAGEDMRNATVIAPVMETLVDISGTLDGPVSNVQFSGITFANTTWLRPAEQGHVPLQDGMFMLNAHKLSPRGTSYHPKLDNVAWIGRPPAAVLVENASHISLKRCAFENLASAGLDFQSGTHDDVVEGCVFRGIGGNGIQLGKFSDTNVETHVPYNPADEREICSRETIANNSISDCGNEDWGCAGISVGYARQIKIEHNEIFDLPYTGISVGWGWTKMTNALRDNLILANRVHDVGKMLGDLGGIYLLSAQPGTVVAGNAVYDIKPCRFVPDPKHWFYLYADEGSSFETFRDNWTSSEQFLRNANGPDNLWTNNGPEVSEKIKNGAGLEPSYHELLIK